MTARKLLLLLVLALPAGCGAGNRSESLASRPIEDIYTEIQDMSVSNLERHVIAYRDTIRLQDTQMKKLKEQMGKLSYADQSGSKATQLANRMEEVGRLKAQLKQRYDIYLDKLRDKKVPLDDYKIDADN